MPQLNLTLDLNNDAFVIDDSTERAYAISDTLASMYNAIEAQSTKGSLVDPNGNTVGSWSITPGPCANRTTDTEVEIASKIITKMFDLGAHEVAIVDNETDATYHTADEAIRAMAAADVESFVFYDKDDNYLGIVAIMWCNTGDEIIHDHSVNRPIERVVDDVMDEYSA